MANKTLNGLDWATAANWGGVLPADGDAVTIANSLTGEIYMSATQSAIDLLTWTVARECPAFLGSDAAPLQVGAGIMHYLGSGALYWLMSDNGSVAQDCEECVIDPASDSVPVHLGSLSTSSDGDFERIIIRSGRVTLLGGTNRCLLDNSTGYVSVSGGAVTLASGVDTIPKLVVGGGTIVDSKATITDLILANATMRQSLGTITSGVVTANGVLQLEVDATTIHVQRNGTLDLSVGSGFRTITTLITDPGARVYGRNSKLVTITNSVGSENLKP